MTNVKNLLKFNVFHALKFVFVMLVYERAFFLIQILDFLNIIIFL